jgi:tetratricopeptide (TPR) repeat protein
MKFAKSSCWLFIGLMLAASGLYAQDAANNNAGNEAKVPVKKSPVKKKVKAVAKKSIKSGVKTVRPKSGTEVRAKAEREAHQRAEAEAKKQAEIEARVKAEQEARQSAEAEARKQAEIEAREKPLRDAEALMKDGKSADAYALLEPLDFERSGEVRFDYMLGIAALDSGKADKATIAFERVMAVDPNFAGARLDMARAYFQLGDLPRAKTEFEEVMKQNPPEMARATIQKYLDAIAAYSQVKQTRMSGYVEGVVGHDSNIANSTTQIFSFAPTSPYYALGFTQLPPAANLQGMYAGVNAGGEVSHTLNANWSLYAGGDLRQHSNESQKLYDMASASGRVGVMYANDQNAYKLTLTDGEFYLASSEHIDSLGLNAEWDHIFSPSNQMSAFMQYGQNRATGVQPTSVLTDARIEGDLDQVTVGTGWAHTFADGKKVAFGSIYAGNELDVAPVIGAPLFGPPGGGRVDGKRRFEGLRIGGQVITSEKLDWIASMGWQYSEYGNVDPLIMDKRSESLYDLTIGANWHFDKLWTVKPQIAYSQRDSNVALYSYDRTDISVTIRRDFK